MSHSAPYPTPRDALTTHAAGRDGRSPVVGYQLGTVEPATINVEVWEIGDAAWGMHDETTDLDNTLARRLAAAGYGQREPVDGEAVCRHCDQLIYQCDYGPGFRPWDLVYRTQDDTLTCWGRETEQGWSRPTGGTHEPQELLTATRLVELDSVGRHPKHQP
jgi:hypothetical protein